PSASPGAGPGDPVRCLGLAQDNSPGGSGRAEIPRRGAASLRRRLAGAGAAVLAGVAKLLRPPPQPWSPISRRSPFRWRGWTLEANRAVEQCGAVARANDFASRRAIP